LLFFFSFFFISLNRVLPSAANFLEILPVFGSLLWMKYFAVRGSQIGVTNHQVELVKELNSTTETDNRIRPL